MDSSSFSANSPDYQWVTVITAKSTAVFGLDLAFLLEWYQERFYDCSRHTAYKYIYYPHDKWFLFEKKFI